jgi:hypothetical protein
MTNERGRQKRQFVPAKELAEALADAPVIDYEELRRDLDAVADPSPKDWYAWAARTDRHVCRGALEGD